MDKSNWNRRHIAIFQSQNDLHLQNLINPPVQPGQRYQTRRLNILKSLWTPVKRVPDTVLYKFQDQTLKVCLIIRNQISCAT